MHTRLVLASLSTLLAGCGDLSGLGGTTEFACKAPPGVHCDSLSGTYYNSLANNLPSQRHHGDVPGGAQEHAPAPPAGTTQAGPGFAPTALRAPGHEMRLWIKAWQDEDRDLADQSYVYLVVSDGQWRIAHVQQEERRAFARLSPPLSVPRPEPGPEPETAPSPAQPSPSTPAVAPAAPAAAVTPIAPVAPLAEAGEPAGK